MPALASNIRPGRLPASQYADNFSDMHPPLSAAQALVESERCYYCFDAPCVQACPTGIDIPSFIRRIGDANLRGAAEAILEANVFGGMCARVCPTEVLCEDACVRHHAEDRPVEIGRLQRHATDAFFKSIEAVEATETRGIDPPTRPAESPATTGGPGRAAAPLFTREAATGKRIAVVGAGPAGLACAHRLACLGHEVTVFEARPKPGGLNEYGLAAYKTTSDFAQKEIAWLLSIGGIELRCGEALGGHATLPGLSRDFDAVFLGLGLSGVNALGLTAKATEGVAGSEFGAAATGEALGDAARGKAPHMASSQADSPADDAVVNAVDFIAGLRQADDYAALPIGRRVVVLGGGMTAVDAAVQAKKLGADEVTIVYRRDQARMPATRYEIGWAQRHGVAIRTWSVLQSLQFEQFQNFQQGGLRGTLVAIFSQVTEAADGQLRPTGESWRLPVDSVLKAIGQTLVLADPGLAALALRAGRIEVDAEGRTSLANVWAGGDCTFGGRDLTVEAVEHGKIAAHSIDRALGMARRGPVFARRRPVGG